MPKVSVIIPTYNRGYIIGQAIGSVLAQTLRDFELLIIDDGSADDTEKTVTSITDARIKYFRKQNGGVSSARNLGMANSRGRYIALLDSDDTWPENFLEVMAARLDEQPDFDAAYASVVYHWPDGSTKCSPHIKLCVSGNITLQLFKHRTIWTSALLLRASALKDFWFDEALKIGEDSDACLRLSTRAKFLFVPDISVLRRLQADSLFKTFHSKEPCTKALFLERFYYRLGGHKLVPFSVAAKKLSHVYRRVARRYGKQGCRTAAVAFFKRAIKYRPLDVRLYIGLAKALMLPAGKDKCSDWQIPKDLDMPSYAITWKKENGLLNKE